MSLPTLTLHHPGTRRRHSIAILVKQESCLRRAFYRAFYGVDEMDVALTAPAPSLSPPNSPSHSPAPALLPSTKEDAQEDEDEEIVLLLLLAAAAYRYDIPPALHRRKALGPDKLRQWQAKPDLLQRQLGMTPATFEGLVEFCEGNGLRSSRFLTAHEKVAVFLYKSRFGISNTVVAEVFGRSRDTISRCFNQVLLTLKSLHSQEVSQPNAWDSPAAQLLE